MSEPIVAVSLKMYFERARTLDYARSLVELVGAEQGLSEAVRMAVLPDFLTIAEAGTILNGSGIVLGAQDLCQDDRGARTGEVSGADLAALGVGVVEVGHAERRTIYREDDAMVAAKTAAAVRNGIIPLLCIGEAERSTEAEAAAKCIAQVRSALAGTRPDDLWLGYEPYWAIGAPAPAPSEYVSGVCRLIREGLGDVPGLSLLYGGSAGPGLLGTLDPAIDGLFLGRFAHDPAAFVSVAKEARDRAVV
ncbi:MAG: triosephosphate isomerase [Propionibacteriaceae bacterium]|jgi:triosephosphate isomerase|uniref:Triosephosphate isomerase n=1 Tax=Propionibacterium ruminifibrarum TaxID=1962131 RepID=A0A375I4F0_9ACTN|nr:triose-phosphate isomerase family protein [Propionibacterium ruminifibrarum]MBE6476911.1 triosephosphate isomerase [Propionibacteriaceae bacterium]SPF68083.1 Triose-phosphate isomerase [Propionibacterium ruminifibrarum]